jgi:hypothetical protein
MIVDFGKRRDIFRFNYCSMAIGQERFAGVAPHYVDTTSKNRPTEIVNPIPYSALNRTIM